MACRKHPPIPHSGFRRTKPLVCQIGNFLWISKQAYGGLSTISHWKTQVRQCKTIFFTKQKKTITKNFILLQVILLKLFILLNRALYSSIS